ncbi:hypothetical protein RUR49_19330 [Pseudoxanthobacter sp. M-2]|uniref:hypothetical protein n=1 Tax=Pseudoxanthobacter sp. M-2 TaxID=3078754 RepID=UPI0038FCE9A9
MSSRPEDDPLDRHALVVAVWLAGGFVAATLLSIGLDRGSFVLTLSAFGAALAAFIGHVIVNEVFRTVFTSRELGLGLVAAVAGLVAIGLGGLVSPEFRASGFLPASLGLIGLATAVVVYMLIRHGVRGAFDAFDVIRDFRR